MMKLLAYLGLGGAACVCVAGVAMAVVGATSLSSASDARRSAQALLDARLEVARAQEQLGTSDLDEAVDGARDANASALGVKRITRRIADLLHATRLDAEEIGRSSRRGVATVVGARRQAEAAARSLSAISTYQRSSSAATRRTNVALVRILRALRETNESFPGRR